MTDPIRKTLPEALSAAQGKLENVGLDGQGNFGKYLTLPALIAAVRPVLAEHGLSWSALPSIGENGQPTMRYQLLHASGEVITGEMALMMSKQDAQGQGSALTYARRYSLAAVLNIGADEDDDGNVASQPRQQARATNGSAPKLATAADVREMNKAGEGLSTEQIKGALADCGIPGVTGYNKVPADKAAEFVKALAAVERS